MKRANLDSLVEEIEDGLRDARVPGTCLAIVEKGEPIFIHAFGERDLASGEPMRLDTRFPIASTTKGINATLVGQLVDEGLIEWDAPVRHNLTEFRLADTYATQHASLRDLLAMRTGLPRHDWTWIESGLERGRMLEILPHLQPSTSFRERFQYNNLGVMVGGLIAERLFGGEWSCLIEERILARIGLRSTGARQSTETNVVASYHCDADRRLSPSTIYDYTETAPAGGILWSTIEDLARWALVNLPGGQSIRDKILSAASFTELHRPQVPTGKDTAGPSPDASYGFGWFIDLHLGRKRVSHGGYLHDVNNEVTLYPDEDLGIVSMTNFGSAGLVRAINQHVAERLFGLPSSNAMKAKTREFEQKIATIQERRRSSPRMSDRIVPRPLSAYPGRYHHPGYGSFEIDLEDGTLRMRRGAMHFPLEHWHGDCWAVTDQSLLARTSQVRSIAPVPCRSPGTADRAVCALVIRLEPELPALEFRRCPTPAE